MHAYTATYWTGGGFGIETCEHENDLLGVYANVVSVYR